MNAPTSETRPMKAAHATNLPGLLVAVFASAMIALAAGALWMLLCLALPQLHARTWPALPLAVVLGYLIRSWVIDAPRPAAILAGLTLLLACAYMRVLLLAGELGASFGMGFMPSLRRAGADTLVHLAWLGLGRDALALYLIAAALAAWVAARSRGPRPGVSSPDSSAR